MSNCKCGSNRIAYISAKSSDLNFVRVGEESSVEGYVPRDMGIGGGDYVEFDWCLNCGQIQGNNFPLAICNLELEDNE